MTPPAPRRAENARRGRPQLAGAPSAPRTTAALAAGLILLLPPARVEGTELRIRVDPARAERAELLVVAWGSAERFPLETPFDDAGRPYIRLPLDDDWLKARWPRLPDMMAAYVYVQFFGGFVSIRSERFVWVGIRDDPTDPPAAVFDIDFGRGRRVRVAPGETREIELAPRPPEARQLRLVDEGGRPVTDALVSAYMFWSDSNHCGVLTGADPIVRSIRPNGSGIVTLPDGDFEYAIEVTGPSLRPVDPAANDYGVFRTHLASAERVVRIHRLRRQPLSMRITVGSAPGKHVPVSGTAARCACGACSGMIAMADEDGRIRIDDFHPEEYDAICIADDRGDAIWKLSASSLTGQPLAVALPPGARPGIATYCEPPP